MSFSESPQESVAADAHSDVLVGAVQTAEKRRGSRLNVEIPITVMGIDTLGEPFKESAVTASVSCYGCKYKTRRYAPKDSIVTLEIPQPNAPREPHIAHARVVWIQRPRHHRETFQIGLELDVPGNVWGIDSPPADWFPPPSETRTPHPEETPIVETVSATPASPLEAPAQPGEWETLQLPPPQVASAPQPEQSQSEIEKPQQLIAETVKKTADALIAEEIALVQKHFTGRLESALLETLKTFSELTAEIVNETREACRATAREIETEIQRIAREAGRNDSQAPHAHEHSLRKPIHGRRRKLAQKNEP
ncbi:MAG TPA: hypothetical protein VMB47_10235 [Candidatus Aquilonibacter sp.]|nr:hypothetical protein [Candidatus Aquilonibacter sp.]